MNPDGISGRLFLQRVTEQREREMATAREEKLEAEERKRAAIRERARKAREAAEKKEKKVNCPACKKPLRKDNTRGAHAACIVAGKAEPKVAEEIPTGAVRKHFLSAARALGHDPEEVLADLMEGWLGKVRGKA